MSLTSNFNFQPEEIIRIDGVVYAVFFDTGEELGDFPILMEVDAMSFIKEGTQIDDLTEDEFADKYKYVFRGHGDGYVSDIATEGDQVNYKSIMDYHEIELDKRAKKNGMEWLLDVDVQTKFLASVLTGIPVGLDELAGTNWGKSSTPEQKEFAAEYYADSNAVMEKIEQNISTITRALYDADFQGDTTELAKVLAMGLSTGKYANSEEVNMYIKYLGDAFFLETVGGDQVLPDELKPFAGQFQTNDGKSVAENNIVSYLGKQALQGYKADGTFLQMAGMIRSGKGKQVIDDLQKVHDTIYPTFAGSKFSSWNPYFSARASRVINGTTGQQVVPLNTKDQLKVNDLIIQAGGDYQKFDASIRKLYQNSPGVKNNFMTDLAKVIPQAYSGVF